MEVGLTAAFMAGLLSFLSPCILPLVPPYLTWLAGASLDEMSGERPAPGTTRRAIIRAAAFVAGFATVFVALGASASFIGQAVADHLGLLSKIAGVVIILFGLHFLGVLKISLLYREARFAVARKPAGLIGAFFMGLAFAFGWTPCVGPVLAAILMLAGAKDTVGEGAGLLGLYAAGIGIPFLLAAAFIGPFLRFLGRFRRYLGIIERVIGAAMVVTGVLIFTGAMADISGWLLETFPALGRIG